MSFDHIEEITNTRYLGFPSMIEYLEDFFKTFDRNLPKRSRVARFFANPTGWGGTAYNLTQICEQRNLDYCDVVNWIVSLIAYPNKNDIEWWIK